MLGIVRSMARRRMFTRTADGALVYFPRAYWFGLEGRGFVMPADWRDGAAMALGGNHYVRQTVIGLGGGLCVGLLDRLVLAPAAQHLAIAGWPMAAMGVFIVPLALWLALFAVNEVHYVRQVRRLVAGLPVAEGVAPPSWQEYVDPDAADAATHARAAGMWVAILAVMLAALAWLLAYPPAERHAWWQGVLLIGTLLAGVLAGSTILAGRTARLREINAELERRIAERTLELAEANRHKSEFLAGMSHELRTPLNAIIGFSEALKERMFGELNDKQAEYVADIHSSGQHLLALINDILDLSKVEAGRMELELSEVDLAALLQGAMALVRERAQRHGIRLDLEATTDIGSLVADGRRLKQVLLNLLSNAVKFTPEGGRVVLGARRADGTIEITVSDTGVGIAPGDLDAIFEEFRQVGSDRTRKAEGTGLGLALTRRFVELHGGTIRVESVPGAGSTFTVNLPVRHG